MNGMICCIFAVFLSLLCAQPAIAASYRFSKIAYPNSDGAVSLEVNSSGRFTANVGSDGPYIWAAKGGEVKLRTVGEDYAAEVLSLNNYGMAVGASTKIYADNFASRATVWSGASSALLPGLGDDRQEVALDINDSGRIVGYSRSVESMLARALFWDENGLHDLGDGGGLSAVASALNNFGTIVGATRFASGSQGTVWKDGNVMHIGTLGGTRSVLSDVNDLGWAVGDSLLEGDNENWRAILWDGVALHNLGTLGGKWSSANNIGEDGTVFGSSLTAGGSQHATIWRGDSAIDLNDLIVNPADLGSMAMTTAIGADAVGAIYGILYDRKSYYNGTFVLTPVIETDVAEPATVTLVLAGAFYFFLCRRRLALNG